MIDPQDKEDEEDAFFLEYFQNALDKINYDVLRTKFLIIPKGEENMTIECTRFKEYKKGPLIGFADVYVQKWDLDLFGISVFEKEGKKWVSFPSKEYEKEGEKKYASHYRMRDENNFKIFCEKIQEAIENKILEDNQTGEKEDEIDDSSFCF